MKKSLASFLLSADAALRREQLAAKKVKDAENKARFILCSNDKAKAYEEVMSGTYDDRKVDACSDEKVSALLKEHRELAAKAGVSVTPSFWINGQVIVGANIPAIESSLKNQKNFN